MERCSVKPTAVPRGRYSRICLAGHKRTGRAWDFDILIELLNRWHKDSRASPRNYLPQDRLRRTPAEKRFWIPK